MSKELGGPKRHEAYDNVGFESYFKQCKYHNFDNTKGEFTQWLFDAGITIDLQVRGENHCLVEPMIYDTLAWNNNPTQLRLRKIR